MTVGNGAVSFCRNRDDAVWRILCPNLRKFQVLSMLSSLHSLDQFTRVVSNPPQRLRTECISDSSLFPTFTSGPSFAQYLCPTAYPRVCFSPFGLRNLLTPRAVVSAGPPNACRPQSAIPLGFTHPFSGHSQVSFFLSPVRSFQHLAKTSLRCNPHQNTARTTDFPMDPSKVFSSPNSPPLPSV